MEFDSEIFEVPIGSEEPQLFSYTGQHVQRPDKAGQFSSSANWTDDYTLEVDIYEIGYPIKERWRFTLNDNILEVTATARGAATSETFFIAER